MANTTRRVFGVYRRGLRSNHARETFDPRVDRPRLGTDDGSICEIRGVCDPRRVRTAGRTAVPSPTGTPKPQMSIKFDMAVPD